MQRRLSVEDDVVVVVEVPLDGVAHFQMLVRAILQHREIDVATVYPLNVLCTRPFVGATLNKHL